MEPAPAPSSGNDLTSIVVAYGEVLETNAPTPGTVADASKLPYPKQQIKEALVAALRAKPDQQTREHLKAAYFCLANWQDGVGDTNQGYDPSSPNENQDVKAFAKQVVAAIEGGKKWTDAARRERGGAKEGT